jgi:hypothetical protein
VTSRALRDTEVGDLDARASVRHRFDEQVLGLDVAVHDATAVRFCEALAHVEDDRDRVADGHRTAVREHTIEVGPFDELEHEIGRSVGETRDVEDAHHVITAEGGDGARFLEQSLHDAVVRGQLRPDHFDRDGHVEIDLPRQEHETHATFAEDGFDAIASNSITFREGVHRRHTK